MSGSLASLTAQYTDSENEDVREVDSGEENENEQEQESEEDETSGSGKAKKAKLVSYNDKKIPSEVQKDGNDDEDEDDIILTSSSMSMSPASDASSDDDLPPEPTGKCPPELQEKVTSLYEKVKEQRLDLTKHIQNLKAFRNPSIYEKLIEFCNINEYGTNYPPHLYDPTKWGKESYYEELAKVQKAEMEKREKERKEKAKVEIVSGMAKRAGSTSQGGASDTQTGNRSSASDGDKKRKTKWDQASVR